MARNIAMTTNNDEMLSVPMTGNAVLPIPIYGVGPKKSASASLLLHTACQPALRQQSLADLAYSISKLAINLHAA